MSSITLNVKIINCITEYIYIYMYIYDRTSMYTSISLHVCLGSYNELSKNILFNKISGNFYLFNFIIHYIIYTM